MTAKKVPQVKMPAGTYYVRCLGPRAEEHWFYSTDYRSHRRCADCEQVLQDMRLGRRAFEPAKDPGGEQ